MRKPLIWAADVGYGHLKFACGRDTGPDGKSQIVSDSIPSQSPVASEYQIASPVLQRRDTFIVPVNGRNYEVGRDVGLALQSNHESAVLDSEFCLSDAYTARLYGAFNYMAQGSARTEVDCLVLGLPMTTYPTHGEALSERFMGEHVINAQGHKVVIKACHTFPQPLGSYAEYLNLIPPHETPLVLVADPGYNTFDWFVCQGMTCSEDRSLDVKRGMSAVLQSAAKTYIAKTKCDASLAEVVRTFDRALATGGKMLAYGKEQSVDEFINAGNDVIEEAAQAMKNHIGAGFDIQAIVLTGGGAKFYEEAIKAKFPNHTVKVLDDPQHANVRGFYQLGELIAGSAYRASELSHA